MSNPAKNSDIEDMLASIRRLVSVDQSGGVTPPVKANGQKLILTPDQRIDLAGDLPGHEADDKRPLLLGLPYATRVWDDDDSGSRTVGSASLDAANDPAAAGDTAPDDTEADDTGPVGNGAAEDKPVTVDGTDTAAAQPSKIDADPLTPASGGGAAANESPEVGEDAEMLDDAALRALVSEIVRSELQGALGERITRNVRKLVRREIMRAMAARDAG